MGLGSSGSVRSDRPGSVSFAATGGLGSLMDSRRGSEEQEGDDEDEMYAGLSMEGPLARGLSRGASGGTGLASGTWAP